jgi:predicted nucleic acid-binding protein
VIVVVDASVAVKWFVREPRHDIARHLLSEGSLRFAPDLVLSEVTNALRKKHKLGEVSTIQAQRALANLPNYFQRLSPAVETVQDAFQFGIDFDHPTMDCVYLAVAHQIGGLLVSDDKKFVEKCQRFGHGSFVSALADLPERSGQSVGLH